MMAGTVLADIENVYNQLAQTQERLSSGKQLTKPSDDPFATSRALLYRAGLAANKQYQANVDDGTSWLDTTDTATDSVTSTQAIVGARTNRLASAASRLQQLELAQTKQLSDTEDADIAQTMIDYSSQTAVYQAALKAGATIIQPSLIDFLR
jgi:flagellin-like hook-associated protein FlgL